MRHNLWPGGTKKERDWENLVGHERTMQKEKEVGGEWHLGMDTQKKKKKKEQHKRGEKEQRASNTFKHHKRKSVRGKKRQKRLQGCSKLGAWAGVSKSRATPAGLESQYIS